MPDESVGILRNAAEPDAISAKDFSIAFVVAVTESSGPQDWIAKNGSNSIFSLLNRIFPQVCSNPC